MTLLNKKIVFSPRKKSSEENVNIKIQAMQTKTRDLRKQVNKLFLSHRFFKLSISMIEERDCVDRLLTFRFSIP